MHIGKSGPKGQVDFPRNPAMLRDINSCGVRMSNSIHFVGFRGDEYHSAVRVWGEPDFFHRVWDVRASHEVVAGDTVVFARPEPVENPRSQAFDDSAVF